MAPELEDAKLQDPVDSGSRTPAFALMDLERRRDRDLVPLTDERARVQPSLAELASGWAPPGFWKTSSVFHFNAIQPWKIERDGG